MAARRVALKEVWVEAVEEDYSSSDDSDSDFDTSDGSTESDSDYSESDSDDLSSEEEGSLPGLISESDSGAGSRRGGAGTSGAAAAAALGAVSAASQWHQQQFKQLLLRGPQDWGPAAAVLASPGASHAVGTSSKEATSAGIKVSKAFGYWVMWSQQRILRRGFYLSKEMLIAATLSSLFPCVPPLLNKAGGASSSKKRSRGHAKGSAPYADIKCWSSLFELRPCPPGMPPNKPVPRGLFTGGRLWGPGAGPGPATHAAPAPAASSPAMASTSSSAPAASTPASGAAASAAATPEALASSSTGLPSASEASGAPGRAGLQMTSEVSNVAAGPSASGGSEGQAQQEVASTSGSCAAEPSMATWVGEAGPAAGVSPSQEPSSALSMSQKVAASLVKARAVLRGVLNLAVLHALRPSSDAGQQQAERTSTAAEAAAGSGTNAAVAEPAPAAAAARTGAEGAVEAGSGHQAQDGAAQSALQIPSRAEGEDRASQSPSAPPQAESQAQDSHAKGAATAGVGGASGAGVGARAAGVDGPVWGAVVASALEAHSKAFLAFLSAQLFLEQVLDHFACINHSVTVRGPLG